MRVRRPGEGKEMYVGKVVPRGKGKGNGKDGRYYRPSE